MYRALIADDDILMREVLDIMTAKDSASKVVHMTGTGEGAVRACEENVTDIVFMDTLMPGMIGPKASRIIYQLNPEINMYILSAHATNILTRSATHSQAKDSLEKPITYNFPKKILENYRIECEDFMQNQPETLASYLRNKNFGNFYGGTAGVIDEIHGVVGEDSIRLIKLFTYLE